MSKYTFDEPRKHDALNNGKFRCYYNEETREKERITPVEGGEPITETVTEYIYDAVDVDALEKGILVDALIRTRYSQADVEAIMRHKIAKDEGATAEFNEFNAFAEECKVIANGILAE